MNSPDDPWEVHSMNRRTFCYSRMTVPLFGNDRISSRCENLSDQIQVGPSSEIERGSKKIK